MRDSRGPFTAKIPVNYSIDGEGNMQGGVIHC
jgi:hypothetical protein